MPRIIDDDKVKMLLTLALSKTKDTKLQYMIIPVDNFVQNIIQNATVGDVVRCKDCRFYNTHDHRCVRMNHGFKDDFFCSWGERKDAEIN